MANRFLSQAKELCWETPKKSESDLQVKDETKLTPSPPTQPSKKHCSAVEKHLKSSSGDTTQLRDTRISSALVHSKQSCYNHVEEFIFNAVL